LFQWIPSVPPLAHIVFIHGYIEHVDRYVPFFNTLSSSPHNIHVVAYDQRGFGRTSRAATPTDHVPDEVLAAWKKEGKTVKSARGNKKTSWAEQMEDAEFFVKRCLNEGKGSKVFLMGQSMVSIGLSLIPAVQAVIMPLSAS
jgi:acylglycerol lipase